MPTNKANLIRAVMSLDMSLMAVKLTLATGSGTVAERLTWAAGELERLAGEAYNLADECEPTAGAETDNWDSLPGFDPDYQP